VYSLLYIIPHLKGSSIFLLPLSSFSLVAPLRVMAGVRPWHCYSCCLGYALSLMQYPAMADGIRRFHLHCLTTTACSCKCDPCSLSLRSP
jgi:hypothetical protein